MSSRSVYQSRSKCFFRSFSDCARCSSSGASRNVFPSGDLLKAFNQADCFQCWAWPRKSFITTQTAKSSGNKDKSSDRNAVDCAETKGVSPSQRTRQNSKEVERIKGYMRCDGLHSRGGSLSWDRIPILSMFGVTGSEGYPTKDRSILFLGDFRHREFPCEEIEGTSRVASHRPNALGNLFAGLAHTRIKRR